MIQDGPRERHAARERDLRGSSVATARSHPTIAAVSQCLAWFKTHEGEAQRQLSERGRGQLT